MEKTLLLQFLTLSIYAVFLECCFSDGFKLSVFRKLLCFIPFLVISVYVFKQDGQLTLELILPVPSLLAFLLCLNERTKLKHLPPNKSN